MIKLNELIESMWSKRTFKSSVPENTWEATGHSQEKYIAFNKYHRGGGDKIVYKAERHRSGLKLSLYVSANNQRKNDFQVAAEQSNTAVWFENKRKNDPICGVETSIVITTLDYNAAINQVIGALDVLYKQYNNVIDP